MERQKLSKEVMCGFLNHFKIKIPKILLTGVFLACALIQNVTAQPSPSSSGGRGIQVEPVPTNYSENSAGLFIGVNDFDDSDVLDLKYAVNDAISQAHVFVVELELIPAKNCFLGLSGEMPQKGTRWANELEDLERAGVDLKKQVFVPTQSKIISHVEALSKYARADQDMAVFAVSSHGIEVDRVPYFFAKDSSYDPRNNRSIRRTAVDLPLVEEYLESVVSQRALMLYDACRDRIDANRSGGSRNVSGVAGSVINSWQNFQGLGLLISCVGDEVSYEEPRFGHGVFTHFFLESIRGRFSGQQDAYLTLGDLSRATSSQVSEWTRRNKGSAQTPEYKGPEGFRDLRLALIRNRLPLNERFQRVFPLLANSQLIPPAVGKEVIELYYRVSISQDWESSLTLIEALESVRPGDLKTGQEFAAFWVNNKSRWIAPAPVITPKPKEEEKPEPVVVVTETEAPAETKIGANPKPDPKPSPQPGVDDFPRKDFTIPKVGIDMVWINPKDKEDGGTFWMGSPESEVGRYRSETRHQVTLTEGYWLGKYEVTQGQWQAVMDNNPSRFTDQGLNAPVENVSWEDVQEFLKKLNKLEEDAGRLPAGYQYALPTEAQWEYACRAGTETAYSFGDSSSGLKKYAWYDGNSATGSIFNRRQHTHSVGQKLPNPWGLYDMHGNVVEWCEDWFAGYPTGPVTNPSGSTSGSDRVTRGGSWNDFAWGCRSAYRFWFTPSNRNSSIGFRLALSSASDR